MMVRVLAPVMAVLIIVVGVVLAMWVSRREQSAKQLRQELYEAQQVLDQIQDRCVELASLGDPNARVILDEIRNYWKEYKE